MPDASAQPLPSHATLIKATVVSMVVAGLLLVVAVLPAEYGIDPTGIGKSLGLTTLSETGKAGPSPATAPTSPTAAMPAETVDKRPNPYYSNTTKVVLAPGQGTEVKASMQVGETLVFSWSTDGGLVRFDMHGEPPNAGDTFTSYWKDADKSSGHGAFVAPFTGTHGWFWANRGSAPVTVTLLTSGFYESIGQR